MSFPRLILRDTVAGVACRFTLTHFGDDDDPDVRLAISFPDFAAAGPSNLLPETWLARLGLDEDEELFFTSGRLQLVLGDRQDAEGRMLGMVDRRQLARLMIRPDHEARTLLQDLTEQRSVSQMAETVRVYRELELEARYGTHHYRLQFIHHAMGLLEHARAEAEERLSHTSIADF